MFSRGQPCLRRPLSAALDTVADGPDELLLFLYPQWVASALRRRQPITSLSPAATPAKSRFLSVPSFRPAWRPSPPLCQQSNRWLSGSAVRSNNDTGLNPSKVVGGHGGTEESADSKNVVPSDDAQKPPTEKPSFNIFADVEKPPSDVSFLSLNRHRHQNLLRSQKNVLRSIIMQGSGRRRSQRQSLYASLRKNSSLGLSKLPLSTRKKLIREGYRTRFSNFARGTLDWEGVLELMESMQDDPRALNLRGSMHQGIEIPVETAAILSGNTKFSDDENIWHLHIHNGCRVHILHSNEGDYNRRAILSGTEHVINLVRERIRHVQYLQEQGDPVIEIRKSPVPILASKEKVIHKNLPVPLIRGVWENNSWKKSKGLDSPRSLYTVKDFAEYVEDLTFMRKPRKVSEPPYKHKIARKIRALFQMESNQRLLSSAALNTALEFLCRNNQFHNARLVFLCGQSVATTESFNILLRSAAENRGIKYFCTILNMMPRARVLPNAGTWAALLRAMVTPDAKAAVVARMVERRYMTDTNTIRTALRHTLEDSLAVHLESGKDIGSFISLMAKTSGANWFPAPIVERLFYTVSRRLKDYQALDELIQLTSEANLPFDDYSLRHILSMVNDVWVTFHFVLRAMNHPGYKISRLMMQKLFEAAIKGRSYNLCRVLWHYACIDETVTHNMKSAVLASLLRNPSWNSKNPSELTTMFRLNFGKMVAGLNVRDGSFAFKNPIINEVPRQWQHNPLHFLNIIPENDAERACQVRLAHAIIRDDMKCTGNKQQPQFSLNIMLEAALAVDWEWTKQRAPLDLLSLMENRIDVPVAPRVSNE